jgi:hypothetical protein
VGFITQYVQAKPLYGMEYHQQQAEANKEQDVQGIGKKFPHRAKIKNRSIRTVCKICFIKIVTARPSGYD